MSAFLTKTVLAGLAAAGALAAGTFIAPAASADSTALSIQDERTDPITISGTCLNPDGSPAAKIPVTIKKRRDPVAMGAGGGGGQNPPDLLSSQLKGGKGKQGQNQEDGRYKILGRTTTDDSGKFEVKNIREPGEIRVELGDRMRTAWDIKMVKNEGKNIDMGNVELRATLGRGEPKKGK